MCTQVVVLTDAGLEESKRINEVCHSHNPPIPFIRVESRGVFASVFTDFGPAFTVYDVDGETTSRCSSHRRSSSGRSSRRSTRCCNRPRRGGGEWEGAFAAM